MYYSLDWRNARAPIQLQSEKLNDVGVAATNTRHDIKEGSWWIAEKIEVKLSAEGLTTEPLSYYCSHTIIPKAYDINKICGIIMELKET